MPALSKITCVARNSRQLLFAAASKENGHTVILGCSNSYLDHKSNLSTQQRCHLLKQDNVTTIRNRSFFKKTPKENVDQESGLPLVDAEKGMLVYTGRLTSSVKNLKFLSFTTSSLAIAAQPFLMSSVAELAMARAGMFGILSLTVFSTPFLLHFVAKKYVTDIYFNEVTKTFTMATRSFFMRRKEMQFKAEDVEIPFIGGMFVTHTIKGMPVCIETLEFRSKTVYMHMVGYDKPKEQLFLDPNGHLKPKAKFGLFEDEKDRLPIETQEDATRLWTEARLRNPDDDMDEREKNYKRQQAN